MEDTLDAQIQKAAFVLGAKIKKYDLEAAEEILERDFPINYPVSDTQMPPLGLICSLCDHTDEHRGINQRILEMVFRFKPDINSQDRFGRTPLHLACRNGNITAVKFLMQMSGLLPNSEGDIVMSGDYQLNVNALTIGGVTPMMKASECGCRELVILLLKGGADPLIKDNLGKDAHSYARVF